MFQSGKIHNGTFKTVRYTMVNYGTKQNTVTKRYVVKELTLPNRTVTHQYMLKKRYTATKQYTVKKNGMLQNST